MTDKDLKTISEKIDSLHNKILNSKFAEMVTESEVLSLILAVQFLNRQQTEIERLKIENQSLRGAANSYKLHYNEARTEAVKQFENIATDLCYKEFGTELEIAHTFVAIINKAKKMVAEEDK